MIKELQNPSPNNQGKKSKACASTEQFAITTELLLFFIPPTRMANFKETKTTIHYNAVHSSSWMNSQRLSKVEKTSDY
jgi:hypothetical protein